MLITWGMCAKHWPRPWSAQCHTLPAPGVAFLQPSYIPSMPRGSTRLVHQLYGVAFFFCSPSQWNLELFSLCYPVSTVKTERNICMTFWDGRFCSMVEIRQTEISATEEGPEGSFATIRSSVAACKWSVQSLWSSFYFICNNDSLLASWNHCPTLVNTH